MPDELHQDGQTRRPHPQPVSGPFLEYDLMSELEQLHHEPEWDGGHNAKTIAKYEDFRILLTTLKVGERIREHRTGGRLSIQTLRGHIRVRALERTFDLPAGRLLTLDQGAPHDVEALEESAFLLTVAWPGRITSGAG